MGSFITLQAVDGRPFEAWLETPQQANGRGIVLLPEVYNVNLWIRRVATRYAAEGYTVLAPDLFWRQQPGCHYEYDRPEPARAQGDAVEVDAVVSDIGVAAAALRSRLSPGAGIGVVGYCLGGRLALLAGVREPVDAVVSYYGVKLELHLDELATLRKPALLHFGDDDPWVPDSAVAAVRARLDPLPNVEKHVHPQAGHGFDRDGNPMYRAQAAERAWARTRAFFAATLPTV